MFLTCTNESKTGFNKWKYPNRKWNDFSDFLNSNPKTPFTKCSSLLLTSPKLIKKKGNRIIQTGNGIIILEPKRHNLSHSVPNSDSDWVLYLNQDSNPDSISVFIDKLTSNFYFYSSWGLCKPSFQFIRPPTHPPNHMAGKVLQTQKLLLQNVPNQWVKNWF